MLQLVPEAMSGFKSRSFRRRLYLLVSLIIIGLQGLVYSAMIALWGARTLDHHLFSLSRLGAVSQVISVVSQALIIFSLAALTFFAQALASDQIVRRNQKLAALQDLLDAWKGLGSSIASIWRGRRLGSNVQLRLLLILSFFIASSLLQIIVPATISVQSTNSTAPLVLEALRLSNVTDSELSSLKITSYFAGNWSSLGSLPYAMDERQSFIAVPPGVQQGIWYSTLPAPESENITFTDLSALQPSVHCASIPRHKGDRYEMDYGLFSSNWSSFGFNISSLMSPREGVLANFSTEAHEATAINGQDYMFGGPKRHRSDPPNQSFNDTVVYLPWRSSPDNSSDIYGTISFALVTTKSNMLSKDPVGIDDPVLRTMTLPVYSWTTNETIGNAPKSAFRENITITFHFWPIACSLYVETVAAEIRGDNALLSHSYNTSSTFNTTTPFVRSPPTTPFERNWAGFLDQVDASETSSGSTHWQGQFMPDKWLESRILALLNTTTSSSAQKLHALEADLQTITSIAYSFLFEQIYASKNSTAANTVTVQGQESISLAKLNINGLQVFIGLACNLVLLVCVLISSGLRPGVEKCADGHMLSGELLDLMYLMKNSALPKLLNNTGAEPYDTVARRAKAEKLDVTYSRLRLDSRNHPFISTKHAEDKTLDIFQMTEDALARVSLMFNSSSERPRYHATLTKSFLFTLIALFFLCAIHFCLAVLWAKGTLYNHHFSLSKLGLAAQTSAVLSQVCTVGLLGLLSFAVQAIAADKFIRREQTVQDLHHTLGSLSGLGASFRALWSGWRDSGHILLPVAELCFFWAATATLHITMPVMVSVSAVNVSTPALIEVATMPGNPIDIGVNLSAITSFDGSPEPIYSQELIEITASVPFLWEARDTLIRLPIGLNNTGFFSTPTNILSSKYTIEDPFAQDLSARCGVIQPQKNTSPEDIVVSYQQIGGTPQTFNHSILTILIHFQYTRQDGLTPRYVAYRIVAGAPGILWFGGAKPTPDSPPNLIFRDLLLRPAHSPDVQMTDTLAVDEAVSLLFISLKSDALQLPDGIGYAHAIPVTRNIRVLSWVNDTQNPTTTLHGQPIRAFNESVTVTFYVWLLGCVLVTNNATARVRGDSRLLSLNVTNPARYEPFPFLSNQPRNALEKYFAPLHDAIISSEGSGGGGSQGVTWIEEALRLTLASQPNLRALEETLSSITSLAYALLVQRWRRRVSDGDNTVLQNWVPEKRTAQGQYLLLRGCLQVNGIPLLVGSVSTLVLVVVSLICVVGHGVTDGVIRDGGVIDLVSLLHDSALPGILAGDDEDDDGRASEVMFETRSSRARRAAVAYGGGSLDLPARVQRRLVQLSNVGSFTRDPTEYNLANESTSLIHSGALSPFPDY